MLFEQIAAGELHLTGLLLLAPHLTDENYREVLRLAKHRSKREITKLVRRLDPWPDVPPRIEPLGPAPGTGQPLTNATWSAFMQALNPVRELAPGDRPSTWLPGRDAELTRHAGVEDAEREPSAPSSAPSDCRGTSVESAEAARTAAELDSEPANAHNDPAAGELGASGAKDQDRAGSWPSPQRYSIQFTVSQEYVDLVERARDLLSHAVPNRSLAEVHLRALRQLVGKLESRKFGVRQSARAAAAAGDNVTHEPPPRSRCRRSDCEVRPVAHGAAEMPSSEKHANDDHGTNDHDTNDHGTNDHGTNDRNAHEREPCTRADAHRDEAVDYPRRRGAYQPADAPGAPRHRGDYQPSHAPNPPDVPRRRDDYQPSDAPGAPRHPDDYQPDDAPGAPRHRGEHASAAPEKRRGRYIPSHVRREVRNRDSGRCAYVAVPATYVAADAQRCRQRASSSSTTTSRSLTGVPRGSRMFRCIAEPTMPSPLKKILGRRTWLGDRGASDSGSTLPGAARRASVGSSTGANRVTTRILPQRSAV